MSKIKYPIALEWPIPENLLRKLKTNPGKFLNSKIFVAFTDPKIYYHLAIESYDAGHEAHGYTSLFLHLEFSGTKTIEANFNFAVESANYRQERTQIYTESKGIGGKFYRMDDLLDPKNNFTINGQLTIKIEGTLTIEKEDIIPAWKCGTSDDALGLGLWEQEGNRDFTVVVDGKEISLHKHVLAARSPVFDRMIQSEMKEAKENKVEIKDFSFEIVEKAMKLCYHHSLVTYTNLDDKMKLLQFFDKYDIEPLKNNLETYLISVINELTVCHLTNCSLLSNAIKLKMACYKFLRNCSIKQTPISNFDDLDKEFALNLFKNTFSHVSK